MLEPALRPTRDSAAEPWLFAVAGARVNVERRPEAPPGALFVGLLDGAHAWAVDANPTLTGTEQGPDLAPATPLDGYVDLMRLYAQEPETVWLAAGRAVQLVDWSRNHRYCSRCAAPTEESDTERARRCPSCGLAAFPRLAPAIITLVARDDGRVLLARNAAWPTAMFSCLAGFVEPGETLESAVRREVKEEVGVEVGALRYFGSQPWPFPHSLMVGFHAQYAGGEITVDGNEISEAAWFGPEALPEIPGRISIARRLIDDWVSRR